MNCEMLRQASHTNVHEATYMTEYAKKNTQMRYHLIPYLATTLSLFDTQFRYHRYSVAE